VTQFEDDLGSVVLVSGVPVCPCFQDVEFEEMHVLGCVSVHEAIVPGVCVRVVGCMHTLVRVCVRARDHPGRTGQGRSSNVVTRERDSHMAARQGGRGREREKERETERGGAQA